jgi:hypothetical protein
VSVDSVTSIHFQSPNPLLLLLGSSDSSPAIHLVSFSFLLHLLKPTDKDEGAHDQNEISISTSSILPTPEGRHESRDFLWPLFFFRLEREKIIIDFNDDHFLFI